MRESAGPPSCGQMAYLEVKSEALGGAGRKSAAQLGIQQDGLDFWLDTSPDVLKRYRRGSG